MTLPQGRIGSVLIRDDAVRKIEIMLSALVGLDPVLLETVVPTIGIDPVVLVRCGEVQDLTSNQAAMPMTGTSALRLNADEALTAAELVGKQEQVAIELAERLIAKFPPAHR